MNRLNKTIKYFGIFIMLIILSRGFLYRSSVNYSKIEVRKNITLTNKNLIKDIDKRTNGKILNIEEIIQLSNKITSEKLNFTFNKVSSNPNVVYEFGNANCIGYSSLFNSIGNYIIKKQSLDDKYEFKHLVGKLDFFGLNIHKLFNSPFFKNHDFNEIRHKLTNQKKYVDPSLRDYLRIDHITSK